MSGRFTQQRRGEDGADGPDEVVLASARRRMRARDFWRELIGRSAMEPRMPEPHDPN